MSIFNLIVNVFLFSSTILLIWVKRSNYVKLIEQVEKLTQRTISTQNLNHNDEVTNLIDAYTHIKSDPNFDMKRIILKLKFLKESNGKDQGLEDLFKMISSIIPLTALIVTISIALFKEDLETLFSFGNLAFDLISLLVMLMIFVNFYSFIINFATEKSNLFINKHLLIAEEIHKEVPTAGSANEANDIENSDNLKTD
ncbi:hypothetical protein [Paenibacillus graminis]|uniref:hypothetical protein n=2 Tax=Paenibacillus graminis TaxID=189425 RepID=UPI002DBC7654|nr:hypothetical protein [Paenibacillus graminis]MEC0169900.1 hypothetical protein [Paenibacillus graminis]